MELFMKASIKEGKKMEQENSIGLMDQNIMEVLLIIILVEMDHINGMIKEFTKEIGY
jgi:hypothetical protein